MIRLPKPDYDAVIQDYFDEVNSLRATHSNWPKAKIAQRAMVKALYDHNGNRGVLPDSAVEGLLGQASNKKMFGELIPPDYTSQGMRYQYATFEVNAKHKIAGGTDIEPYSSTAPY
jgi:hypothetical protein